MGDPYKYTPSEVTQDRSFEDIDTWRKAYSVQVRKHGLDDILVDSDEYHNATMPLLSFEEVTLPRCAEKLKAKDFKNPTPVQAQTWPIAMSGLDVVGIAETGSGKTLAFGLPAFFHCNKAVKKSDAPYALVLAPTRELVIQIKEEMTSYSDLTVNCMYGGTRVSRSADSQILVGTPGRILDLFTRRWLLADSITYLVLDEADRLLDQGFQKPLYDICAFLPKQRQTLMWTATWPREVEKVAKTYMPNGWLAVYTGYNYMKANVNIRQFVWVMQQHEKNEKFIKLLRQTVGKRGEEKKCLVFFNSRTGCERAKCLLDNEELPAFVISGSMEQRDREMSLSKFHQMSAPAILLATDVAQRGLHIPDLTLVCNYDFPKEIESYTHRIGRTGRMGQIGDAYSFLTPADANLAPHLVKVMNEANMEIDEDLEQLARGITPSRSWGGEEEFAQRGNGGGGGNWGGGNDSWGGGNDSWGGSSWGGNNSWGGGKGGKGERDSWGGNNSWDQGGWGGSWNGGKGGKGSYDQKGGKSWGGKGSKGGDKGRKGYNEWDNSWEASKGSDEWGSKKNDWGKNEWDYKKSDWDKKDNEWGSKKDEWGDKKDEWGSKKDEWGGKKDEWGSKKDEWGSKKDEWGGKKDEWGSKKDEWGSKKDEWGSKKDEWDKKKDAGWGEKKEDDGWVEEDEWGNKKREDWSGKNERDNTKKDSWGSDAAGKSKDDDAW
eukprot:TRINITY_DN7244_c1_g1_i2.p1 TRINITY_DN7244_c1_g1~~TRINITY_DN7244_c1_g1_i2.p1  ORF type:complete len:714 (+),score=195.96 TRINITY_DN7244_c1_g1_i2:50-2191(+)